VAHRFQCLRSAGSPSAVCPPQSRMSMYRAAIILMEIRRQTAGDCDTGVSAWGKGQAAAIANMAQPPSIRQSGRRGPRTEPVALAYAMPRSGEQCIHRVVARLPERLQRQDYTLHPLRTTIAQI
jgi:hypothetical protein